jgi:hypothetical protein
VLFALTVATCMLTTASSREHVRDIGRNTRHRQRHHEHFWADRRHRDAARGRRSLKLFGNWNVPPLLAGLFVMGAVLGIHRPEEARVRG